VRLYVFKLLLHESLLHSFVIIVIKNVEN
jgi:hypothetical protein